MKGVNQSHSRYLVSIMPTFEIVFAKPLMGPRLNETRRDLGSGPDLVLEIYPETGPLINEVLENDDLLGK